MTCMNSWWARLRQPYPFEAELRDHLTTAGVISLGVFLVLATLQPFGIDELPSPKVWATAAAYAGVCFATILLNALSVGAWLHRQMEERWKVYHGIGWICYNIVAVGLANFALGAWLRNFDLSWQGAGFILLATFWVALLPVTLVVMLRQNRLLQAHLRAAGTLGQELTHYHRSHSLPTDLEEPPSPTVWLPADDKGQGLELALDAFYFAKADDNYVEIYVGNDHQLERKLLRTTLKKVETALVGHPQLFRCHRSYLVNLHRVTSIQGNAQGYRLGFAPAGHQVPVARNLAKILKDKMAL
jgi:LytTr DNA-binding domain